MYYSRSYIKDKWDSLKRDMEGVLDINNEELEDPIPEDTIKKVKGNIIDKMTAIIEEIGK